MNTATRIWSLAKSAYMWPGHGAFALPARWYLAWVFLTACWHKILDPHLFAIDVATYQILPLSTINLAAITLPWVELGAGIMLVIAWRARAAALMVAGMMIIFMVALSMALAAGLDMSCGCFASSAAEGEDMISTATLWRDARWLALAVYVVLFDHKPWGVDWWLARRAARSASPAPQS